MSATDTLAPMVIFFVCVFVFFLSRAHQTKQQVRGYPRYVLRIIFTLRIMLGLFWDVERSLLVRRCIEIAHSYKGARIE